MPKLDCEGGGSNILIAVIIIIIIVLIVIMICYGLNTNKNGINNNKNTTCINKQENFSSCWVPPGGGQLCIP